MDLNAQVRGSPPRSSRPWRMKPYRRSCTPQQPLGAVQPRRRPRPQPADGDQKYAREVCDRACWEVRWSQIGLRHVCPQASLTSTCICEELMIGSLERERKHKVDGWKPHGLARCLRWRDIFHGQLWYTPLECGFHKDWLAWKLLAIAFSQGCPCRVRHWHA